jgi:pentatricopeptide repeat protein
MHRAHSLREIASANRRWMFANVIRSFRRTGDGDRAREILRNARECGTYPSALRLPRGFTNAPFA